MTSTPYSARTTGSGMPEKGQRVVRLFAFEIFDTKRDHGLSIAATWGLQALVLKADYRTATWTGTLTELVPEVFDTRRTARQAIDELVAEGLVVEDRPFGQNRRGVLFIAAYPDLVALTDGHWDRILERRSGLAARATGQCRMDDCVDPVTEGSIYCAMHETF